MKKGNKATNRIWCQVTITFSAVALPVGVGWSHYEEGQENLAVLEGFVLLIFCLWLAKVINRKAFSNESDF